MSRIGSVSQFHELIGLIIMYGRDDNSYYEAKEIT